MIEARHKTLGSRKDRVKEGPCGVGAADPSALPRSRCPKQTRRVDTSVRLGLWRAFSVSKTAQAAWQGGCVVAHTFG